MTTQEGQTQTIDTLNPAQMEYYKNRCIEMYLSVDPLNKTTVDSLCEAVYVQAGLTKPVIKYVKSPLALLVFAKYAKLQKQKGDVEFSSLDLDQAWDMICGKPRAKSWEMVSAVIAPNVKSGIWDGVVSPSVVNVWGEVKSYVNSQIINLSETQLDQVFTDLNIQDSAEVKENILQNGLFNEWGECYAWAQSDPSFLMFYGYLNKVCNLTAQTAEITPFMYLTKFTGWNMFYKGLAILSEKPTIITVDGQNDLTSQDEPCIKWADGYEIYKKNGKLVSKEEKIAIDQAEVQQGLEQPVSNAENNFEQDLQAITAAQEYTARRMLEEAEEKRLAQLP